MQSWDQCSAGVELCPFGQALSYTGWCVYSVHTCTVAVCNRRDIGDEFHFLFICPFFHEKRREVLANKYTQRPNAITFETLLNASDKKTLLKLKHFICCINNALA